MVVTYVAGNRAIGTNAERLALNSLQVSGVGGWKELARTSNSALPDVSSLPNKRYYMILNSMNSSSSNPAIYWRLNNDSTSSYSRRTNSLGGESAIISETALNYITDSAGGSYSIPYFAVGYLANYSTKEKLVIAHGVNSKGGTGSGIIPARLEFTGKWANTSNSVSRIAVPSEAGTFASDGELVVLGWDPADTHTTNFWTELASTTLSSTASTIDSGTIPAKKYLWIQAFVKQASTYTVGLQFNSDNTSSYAIRYSGNGGADGTSINTWKCASNYSSFGGGMFLNAFIINNQSKEKLVISHTNEVDTTGAGAASNRIEMVGKWANTSNQITSIQLRKETGTGDLQSGTIMKVWGSD